MESGGVGNQSVKPRETETPRSGLVQFRLCTIAHNRKNWLHVGSVQAGPKIAAIASVVESCRRLGLPVVDYLMDVLPGLMDRPVSQVAHLTPSRWAAARTK